MIKDFVIPRGEKKQPKHQQPHTHTTIGMIDERLDNIDMDIDYLNRMLESNGAEFMNELLKMKAQCKTLATMVIVFAIYLLVATVVWILGL